ncbi:hypothetical protein GCM10010528_23720 [Gordonia defluvii]|uniref:HipA-like C-terminal domain-containing protein n=1 Tax=Gordonia defluvii TaxID=283718 RepID=A0ABP6LGM7_9ACTN
MTARHGSYIDLLGVFRQYGNDVGRELFARVAFNIAISNTDDHLRNHAAFWDGYRLELTPAYDLSPMIRSGETASQAIAYSSDGERVSNLTALGKCAGEYGLTRAAGAEVIDRIVDTIRSQWDAAADVARLTQAERDALYGRQFLNPGSTR